MYAIFWSDGMPQSDPLDEWDCVGTYEDKDAARIDLKAYWDNDPVSVYVLMYIPKHMYL